MQADNSMKQLQAKAKVHPAGANAAGWENRLQAKL